MVDTNQIKAILDRHKTVRSLNLQNGTQTVSIAVSYGRLMCTFHDRKKHGEIICTKAFEDVDPEIQEALYDAVTATYRAMQYCKYTGKDVVKKNRSMVSIVKAFKRKNIDAVLAAQSCKGKYNSDMCIAGKTVRAIAKNSGYSNFSVNPKQLADACIEQFLFIGDSTAWLLDKWRVQMLATDKRMTGRDMWYCINGKSVEEYATLSINF